LIQKEFIQILRDKTMLPIIIVVPFIQLIVLVYAATLEMKNIDLYVVDQDMSASSKQLINKFEASPFYTLYGKGFSIKEATALLDHDKIDVILNIPNDFEKNLITGQNPDLQLLINAINSTAAGLINAYSNYVIADFNKQAITENINYMIPVKTKNINIIYSYWYNPELDYKIYMLPGILVVLVTIMGGFLAALNIVREKEMGTIEQINVTPIQKYQFIIGKLVPFWIIALFELAFGITLGRVLFDVPVIGSIWLLFGFAGAYLLVALGLGLLISTLANTQQQVMFIFFFFLLTFILMSGIFTPTESMPYWAQKVNIINPFAYFIRVIRMIMLKGSGFWDVSKELFSLLIYGSILLSLAVWRYRKTA
jgi:ABC-2 type transport system permease protein